MRARPRPPRAIQYPLSPRAIQYPGAGLLRGAPPPARPSLRFAGRRGRLFGFRRREWPQRAPSDSDASRPSSAQKTKALAARLPGRALTRTRDQRGEHGEGRRAAAAGGTGMPRRIVRWRGHSRAAGGVGRRTAAAAATGSHPGEGFGASREPARRPGDPRRRVSSQFRIATLSEVAAGSAGIRPAGNVLFYRPAASNGWGLGP